MKTTGRQLRAGKGIFMNIYELSKWPFKLSWEEETTRSRPEFPLYLFFSFLHTCLPLSCLLSLSPVFLPLSPSVAFLPSYLHTFLFLLFPLLYRFLLPLLSYFSFIPFSSSSLHLPFLHFSPSIHAPLLLLFLPFSPS
jgi:hypothetical protein